MSQLPNTDSTEKEIKESEKSKRILLVTDSAADIPPQVAKDRGIVVVPLTIHIDDHEYLDGIDISHNQFYSMLAQSKQFPSTSPPSEEYFHELFLDTIAEKDVLCIFISSKMSKMCDIARQAKMNKYNSYLKKRRGNKDMARKVRIDIIDSQLVSMGNAMLVLEASDKIQAGWPLEKVTAHIEEIRENIRVFFMVDNLKYLVRGGRIGRGSALLGKLFGFKPILGMGGGGVDAKARAIGGKRAQRKLIDFMKEDLGDTTRKIRVGICHADAPKKAALVQEMVESEFSNREMVTSHFGPTVGAHTGPGAVGVAYYALPQDEN